MYCTISSLHSSQSSWSNLSGTHGPSSACSNDGILYSLSQVQQAGGGAFLLLASSGNNQQYPNPSLIKRIRHKFGDRLNIPPLRHKDVRFSYASNSHHEIIIIPSQSRFRSAPQQRQGRRSYQATGSQVSSQASRNARGSRTPRGIPYRFMAP